MMQNTAVTPGTFGRHFVRGKHDATDPDYLPENDDTFFAGLVCAEFAANYDEIDCAGCGSADICRTPLTAPHMFGVLTTVEGHAYGYALCKPCKADLNAACDRIDVAFDRLVNEAVGASGSNRS
jgi:hypothetical protein